MVQKNFVKNGAVELRIASFHFVRTHTTKEKYLTMSSSPKPIEKDEENSSNAQRREDLSGEKYGSKFLANRFLRVHFQVLKALYEKDTSSHLVSLDIRVKDEYWSSVEIFLRERNTIQRTTKRAQRMRDILDEAREFQNNMPTFPIMSNHVKSYQTSPQFKSHNIFSDDSKVTQPKSTFGSMLITQPSPRGLPNQPSRWNSKFGGRKILNKDNDALHNTQSNMMRDEQGNAFGLVSGLLERKYSLARRQLNQRTCKLQILTKECRRHIEILSSDLAMLKDNGFSIRKYPEMSNHDFKQAKEECENLQILIETRIRLWRLLLHDLSQTMFVQLNPTESNNT